MLGKENMNLMNIRLLMIIMNERQKNKNIYGAYTFYLKHTHMHTSARVHTPCENMSQKNYQMDEEKLLLLK